MNEKNKYDEAAKKQIEEMAKTLFLARETGDLKYSQLRSIAKDLYNADYRKQSEGEWIIKSEIYKLIDDVDEELFVECSICQRRFNVPYELDDEKIFKYAREHYPYCNCGAKMKGGAV